MTEPYKYRAFISYSHRDEKWAAWLHKALETYRVPKYLVGQESARGPVPARLAPVFRDRDELSTSHCLGNELTQALADSACQIVICSPSAAQSHWTNEEILTYKRLGRSDRILCLIVDGEPGASDDPQRADEECFPPALRYEMGADGELSDRRSEPMAADARRGKDNRHNAKLKLIAGMLGVGFDALRQREQQRRHRRMAALAVASMAGMVITSGLAVTAYLARIEAEQQRNRAEVEAETARQTTQFMVGLFKVSDPSEALGNTITAREILDKGAQRIDDELVEQPEIQATLMDTMGTVYTSLGLYPEAERLVERSLQKRRDLFGEQHHEVAASLTHLGEVQTLNAEYDAAETNLRQSLAVRRALFGATSAPVADTATLLAEVLQNMGNYDDAHALIVEALAVRRDIHDEPHEAIADSLEELGINDYNQGRFAEAEQALRNAVAMRRQLHGDTHPGLAEAMNNLAWVLLDVGGEEEAEALFRDALDMKRRLLGDRHPEVAFGLNNLAWVLTNITSNNAAAIAAYREALSIYEEAFGEQHPEIAVTLMNLAGTMHAQGAVDEALGLARDSLAMRRHLFGPEHPAIATVAVSLAVWLLDRQAYGEAEELLFEGLAIRRTAFGEAHPQTATAMGVIARLMVETGRFDKAQQYAREARTALSQEFPEDNWRVAMTRYYEGLAVAGLGDFEIAEPLLLAGVAGLERAPIPGLAEQARSGIADFYESWGRPQQATAFRD